jgi:hypothetical protein
MDGIEREIENGGVETIGNDPQVFRLAFLVDVKMHPHFAGLNEIAILTNIVMPSLFDG